MTTCQMALQLLASLSASTFTKLQPRNFILARSSSDGFPSSRVHFVAAAAKMADQTIIHRRSANYQPPIWGYEYIQSLKSDYMGESYAKRIKKLKDDVRVMFDQVADANPLPQLELVDTLQRLGISYYFDEEIKRILNYICNGKYRNDRQKEESLYDAALEFRLLRQHGYDIPAAETFCSFMDEKGNFKSRLINDCKGLLALYEAVYLLAEEESIFFHDTLNFTTTYLKEYVKNNKDQYLTTLVNHALELPLHWRVLRLEARWFIDVYKSAPRRNTLLLELAVLDFNVAQAIHQEDLKYVSRWWKKMGLGEKLNFARDRMMENFFWTMGVIFDPQFGYCRRMCAKVNALITTIDDVYDVYGVLDELKMFTDAVDRWDISAMDELPYYMKLCFLALHNSINEMAFDALQEQGVHIISYLKKAWTDLCKCYLLEANWFNSGYTPALEEYVDNAWISISAPVILVHAYASATNPITKEDMECLREYPNIIRWSSMILRLANDLGTSSPEMKRGDVAKSIQCYMHETGASEDVAREHVRGLIAATWMKLNKFNRIGSNSLFSRTFIDTAMNLARMAQCMYQHGDGHASQDLKTKDRIFSLLIHPIPVAYVGESSQISSGCP